MQFVYRTNYTFIYCMQKNNFSFNPHEVIEKGERDCLKLNSRSRVYNIMLLPLNQEVVDI